MKKFFIVLGSIFLAIVVLGAIGSAFVAVRGNALDKESKAYADAAIPAIANGWNEKELLDRASPEFKRAATQQRNRRIGSDRNRVRRSAWPRARQRKQGVC